MRGSAGLRPGEVGDGGSSAVQGAVRTAVVVLISEGVQQGLQLCDRGRLSGLGVDPLLHRLVQAFDLAAGGRVVRGGVLLHDPEPVQLGLERVPAAATASEAGGEHHAVV